MYEQGFIQNIHNPLQNTTGGIHETFKYNTNSIRICCIICKIVAGRQLHWHLYAQSHIWTCTFQIKTNEAG